MSVDENSPREASANGDKEEQVDLKNMTNEELDEFIDDAMKELTEKLWFRVYLILMSSLSITEAVLVGYDSSGDYFKAQVIILAVSSGIFLVGNYGIIQYVVWKGLSLCKALNAFITPGETKLEIVCFIIGWACIFENRGLAAFRILRVVRVLWFLELEDEDDEHEQEESKWYSRGLLVVKKGGSLVIIYLERIGNELFSSNTRGGSVVLLIYFYTIYVFAVIYWNEVGTYNSSNTTWYNSNTNQEACNTLSNCYITLMRLSLYDGNGFDFISNMTNAPQKGLAALLILYMCFTAVTLLNGLIGIFSQAFTKDVDDDDDEDKEEEDEKKKKKRRK